MMQIGLNVFWDKTDFHPHSKIMLDSEARLDFAVCHINAVNKSLDDVCAIAENISDRFHTLGLPYIANFEQANFDRSCKGPDGFEWANHPDGTHRMVFPERMLKALNKNGNLLGILYDELEHMIINRNAGIGINARLNVFPLPEKPSVLNDGEELKRDLTPYVAQIKKCGVPRFAGEHVFPVMYHLFAASGITPNFKSQKESFSNVQYAIASGAALEYDTELWNCVDMWFMRRHPGHSAREMYNNLVFAYESGVSKVYVESSAAMVEGGTINEYGREFIRFTHEYHGKPRPFEISDLRPKIAIIRYDDTYWGQSGILLWKRILFGDERLKPGPRQKEYLHVFHLLTHGETCRGGINWGRFTPWSLRKHRSFASMGSVCVFDENVRSPKLESLELCFLCGEFISEETLKNIGSLVKNKGLVAVTTRRFLPSHVQSRCRRSPYVIPEGKGKWIVVKSFKSARLKRLLSGCLGKKGEIRLCFQNHECTLRISPDGDALTIANNLEKGMDK